MRLLSWKEARKVSEYKYRGFEWLAEFMRMNLPMAMVISLILVSFVSVLTVLTYSGITMQAAHTRAETCRSQGAEPVYHYLPDQGGVKIVRNVSCRDKEGRLFSSDPPEPPEAPETEKEKK